MQLKVPVTRENEDPSITHLYKPMPEVTEYVQYESRIVATQTAHAIKPESGFTARHFFCPVCGRLYASRTAGSATTGHSVQKSACGEHTKTGVDLLSPWEWNHLESIGIEFLAFLFLINTEEEEI